MNEHVVAGVGKEFNPRQLDQAAEPIFHERLQLVVIASIKGNELELGVVGAVENDIDHFKVVERREGGGTRLNVAQKNLSEGGGVASDGISLDLAGVYARKHFVRLQAEPLSDQ